ncbi:MAG: DUF1801 domain-containing protein [Brevundimonas sp.]
MGNAVETWLGALSPENRSLVDRLRAVVKAAAPDLTETIKWNAPNFADGDQDRVTLGVERKGGVRVVLHRGAAVKDAAGFKFDDPDGVAKWPTPDRGVVTFRDLTALEAGAAPLEDLVRRWITANHA